VVAAKLQMRERGKGVKLWACAGEIYIDAARGTERNPGKLHIRTLGGEEAGAVAVSPGGGADHEEGDERTIEAVEARAERLSWRC
jgi:hypothetical protein